MDAKLYNITTGQGISIDRVYNLVGDHIEDYKLDDVIYTGVPVGTLLNCVNNMPTGGNYKPSKYWKGVITGWLLALSPDDVIKVVRESNEDAYYAIEVIN